MSDRSGFFSRLLFVKCHPDEEQSTPSSGVDCEEEGGLPDVSFAIAECHSSAKDRS
jgi:hypothetical protein